MKKKTIYYGEITAGKGLLLGGVKKHTSIGFQTKQEAENWLYQAKQANQDAQRDMLSCEIISKTIPKTS